MGLLPPNEKRLGMAGHPCCSTLFRQIILGFGYLSLMFDRGEAREGMYMAELVLFSVCHYVLLLVAALNLFVNSGL